MRNLVARLLAAWLLLGGVGPLAAGSAPPRDPAGMRASARRAPPDARERANPTRERAGPDANAAPEADRTEEPPVDAEPAEPVQKPYRPVGLEVDQIIWLDPGQQGMIEAHPLVMGLAAMALATVTLLFFFLRGVKRPRDEEL